MGVGTLEQLSHLWSTPRFLPFLGMTTGLDIPASSSGVDREDGLAGGGLRG